MRKKLHTYKKNRSVISKSKTNINVNALQTEDGCISDTKFLEQFKEYLESNDIILNVGERTNDYTEFFEELESMIREVKTNNTILDNKIDSAIVLFNEFKNIICDRISESSTCAKLELENLKYCLERMPTDNECSPNNDAANNVPSICFHRHLFYDSWGSWVYDQSVKINSRGNFIVRQSNSTPGIRSQAIDVPGPGLYQASVIFKSKLDEKYNWVVRILVASDGELLSHDISISEIFQDVVFYIPRRVNQIEVKIISCSPSVGISADIKEFRLSKIDDEMYYVMNRTKIDFDVVASMASVPDRKAMLFDAVYSLLPQCDIVRVFLNNYDEVPEFLCHPRIQIRRSQDYDDNGDAGKFHWITPKASSGYLLFCDDDLLYPPDLVRHFASKISQYNYKVILGLHGIILRQPLNDYYEPSNRKVFHFGSCLNKSKQVHVLGTGIMFAHSSSLNLHCADFMYPNMADIWMLKYATINKIPSIAIDRPKFWVRENKQQEKYETIYSNSYKRSRGAFDSSSVQNFVLNYLMPFTLPIHNKESALVVVVVDEMHNFNEFVQNFNKTCGDKYEWKLIFIFNFAGLISSKLPLSLFNHEHHILSLDTEKEQIEKYFDFSWCDNFSFCIFLHTSIRFKNTDWRRGALDRFLESSIEAGGYFLKNNQFFTEISLEESPLFAYFKPTAVHFCKSYLFNSVPVPRILPNDNSLSSPDDQFEQQKDCNELSYLIIDRILSACLKISDASIFRMDLPALQFSDPSSFSSSSTQSQGHISSFFERVVVLNLDRRIDRWTKISSQLQGLGVTPERYRAIDGTWPEVQHAYRNYAVSPLRRVSKDFLRINSQKDFYINAITEAQRIAHIEQLYKSKAIATSGAFGYLRSMIYILESAIQDGVETLLMLDDDALFHKNTENIFASAVAELPSDWLILQLGTLQYDWDQDWITWRSKHLYSQNGASIGSHAVGLRREIFPFLLAHAKRIELPYDVGPLSAATRAFPQRNFVIYPNIAIQSIADSDIRSSEFQSKRSRDSIFSTYRWIKDDYF